MDGATGNLLNIGKRHSDLFENIHDGSIFNHYLATSNNQIKEIYTIVMVSALNLFTTTGFWLWYGPKRLNRIKS